MDSFGAIYKNVSTNYLAWLLTNNKPSYFEFRMIRETPTPCRHLKECYLRGGGRKKKLEHVLASLSRELGGSPVFCVFKVISAENCCEFVSTAEPLAPTAEHGPSPPLPICLLALPPTPSPHCRGRGTHKTSFFCIC